MMRLFLVCTVSYLVLLANATVSAATAQLAKQWGCTGNPDIPWNQQIANCTNGIQSGKYAGADIAWAYNNRGLAYQRGSDDQIRALGNYDEAIRLDPHNPQYFANRADAYQAYGKLDLAIADYSAAIGLDPKYESAYRGRGAAYQLRNDFTRAVADFSKAIEIAPTNGDLLVARGRAEIYAGMLPKALLDFNRAKVINPKDAYTALWLYIADKRGKLPDQLVDAAKQIDMSVWPAPLIRLYLGQQNPQEVLASADMDSRKNHVCEDNFYSGELALTQGNADEAKRLFAIVATGCRQRVTLLGDAAAELKILNAKP